MEPVGSYFTGGELHRPFSKGKYRHPGESNLSVCALVASLPSADGLPLYYKYQAQLFHPSAEERQICVLVQASPVLIHSTGTLICITLCNRWFRREIGSSSTLHRWVKHGPVDTGRVAKESPTCFWVSRLEFGSGVLCLGEDSREHSKVTLSRGGRWKHEQLGLEVRSKTNEQRVHPSYQAPWHGGDACMKQT